MNLYTIKPYQETDKKLWNSFVYQAKNATFLFERNYMDYHQDRFIDASVLVFDAKNNLKAIFPANKDAQTIFSHQGLTYGGVLINEKLKLVEFIEIFEAIKKYYKILGFTKLVIKPIPSMYCNIPSDELNYVLFTNGAKVFRRNIISVLNINNSYNYSNLRKRELSKSKANNLIIKKESIFEPFWNEILIPNLQQKYNEMPVHTLTEIEYLAERFPENIQQYNVYQEDKILGGVTVYKNNEVVKTQYISASKQGKELRALDFLFFKFLTQEFKSFKYLDFGTSNKPDEVTPNFDLLFWKESFGARTCIQDFYELSI